MQPTREQDGAANPLRGRVGRLLSGFDWTYGSSEGGLAYVTWLADLRRYAERMIARPAKPDDLPWISEVHVSSSHAAYSNIYPPEHFADFTVEKRTQEFTELYFEPGVSIAVVDKEGVIGFCVHSASRDPDLDPQITYEIQSVYVDPARWNQGVGTVLVDFAVCEAQSSGYREVALWVLDSNHQAIQFYRNRGFYSDDATKASLAYGKIFTELRYRITTGA